MKKNASPPCSEHSHEACLKSLIPIRDALDVISGKWKLQIIVAISSGNKRFTDIQKQIPRISPRMLSKELRELELNQLVKREVFDSLPVSIEYSLTPYADTLDEVIDVLRNWGIKHRKKMLAAKR